MCFAQHTRAALVAAYHALRTVGVPSLDLWSTLLERPNLSVLVHEDNETAILAMRSGHSAAMRHLERTHGVCLRWLASRFRCPEYELCYERPALQAAEIYTKSFVCSAEWTRNLKLINHLEPETFWPGRSTGVKTEMLSEHKGGVVFDYWTHNPWFEQSARLSEPTKAAVATKCRASESFHDWFDDCHTFQH